jgi:acyl carrier protein
MDRRNKILELISSTAKKPVNIEPGESLFESGVLDSFALPDLVAALEQEFGLSIPDSDLNPRKFDSVERIEEYLDSRA